MEDLGTWQYATAAKSSIIQNDIKCVTLAQMKMNKDVQKLENHVQGISYF